MDSSDEESPIFILDSDSNSSDDELNQIDDDSISLPTFETDDSNPSENDFEATMYEEAESEKDDFQTDSEDENQIENEEEEANSREVVKEFKRQEALNSLEEIIAHQAMAWSNPELVFESEEERKRGPTLHYPSQSWENVKFDPSFGIVRKNPDEEDIRFSKISYGRKTSRPRYLRIMTVLETMWQLLTDNEIMTQRELYYQLLNSDGGGTPSQIYDAIKIITVMLQIPRIDLGISSTSKGLIMGNISFHMNSGDVLNCLAPQSIPNEIDDIDQIETSSNIVVIVEKDAVFQKLVGEEFLQTFVWNNSRDAIILTGKGYPDLSTRKLVRRLAESEEFDVQFFVLVS